MTGRTSPILKRQSSNAVAAKRDALVTRLAHGHVLGRRGNPPTMARRLCRSIELFIDIDGFVGREQYLGAVLLDDIQVRF